MWFGWALLWREWWDGCCWTRLPHPATSQDQPEHNEHRYRSGRTLQPLPGFSFQSLLIFVSRSHTRCVWLQTIASNVHVNVWVPRLWTCWLHPRLDLISLWGVTHMSQKPVGRDGPLWFACVCCTLGVHFSLGGFGGGWVWGGEHRSSKCHAAWRTHLVSGDNISDWWGHLCLYCVCLGVGGWVGVFLGACVPGFVWNGATWSWIKTLFKRIRDRWRPIVSGCVY